MRCVIYARYSSDHQSERSIDDQVRLCREYAERQGWSVIDVYADYAISGSHLNSRPRALQLLEDAKAKRFDLVLTEALDRLSRSQRDIADIYERIRFAGASLYTVGGGEVTELHVGLEGTMSALFLRNLAAKVKRGMSGRVAEGRSAGGLSYGYRVVPEIDARGNVIRGGRVIDPDQAAVVRRIFREYAAGKSAREIATGLNRDGIPAPSGKQWNASTINGNRSRRSGLLYNELYIGMMVWNRTHFMKDPDTGRRISRPNPPEEWQVAEVPDLRIIDDQTWEEVHARKSHYAEYPIHVARRPKHVFSGLVRCGVCGGAYVSKTRDYMGCSTHKESGTCSNNRSIKVGELEDRVLGALKNRLLDPEAIALAVKVYHEERKRLRQEDGQRLVRLERRLGDLDKQISNIVDMVAEGLATRSMAAKLIDLEAEQDKVTSEIKRLTEGDAAVIELHPGAADRWRAWVANLLEALRGSDEQTRRAVELVRSMVAYIEVIPGEARGEKYLRLHGHLAQIVNLAQRKPGEALSTAIMVAEEGLEPPTRGL
ncbi:recombinase family protein [Telmatospirillum sp. J64-1]|uniref:recombinase family protein n=1 Tax=Telmatospirillum sp. J64-1 TaxID=2502183 RepID=UPI00115F5103|nr:recombinase family protein [Telmatospirillum sp. J64-1]